MSSSIGLGFIGCGEIARETAGYVVDSPYAHLVTATDTVPSLAADLAHSFGVEQSADVEQVLAHPDVQAVYIAVPHDLHADLAVAALRAGKDVLVEKPIATTLQDADRMILAAEECDRVLSVAFSAQSDPPMIAVRDLIRSGAIGRVTGTRIVRRLDKPDYYWSEGYERRNADDWRSSMRRAGGGVLMMNAIHALNTVRFVTGLEVAHLSCEFDTFTTPVEVEDFAAVLYRYVGGAIGTVEASSAVRGGDPGDEVDRIYGERGQVLLTEQPQVYLAEPFGSLEAGRWVPVEHGPLRAARSQPDTHPALIDGFALACLSRQQPPVTGADGRAALEIVLAAYASGLAGRRIDLPLVPAATAAGSDERPPAGDNVTRPAPAGLGDKRQGV